MSGARSVTANFSPTGGPPSWYDPGTYRRPLTIQASQVSGGVNLSNFPVLVKFAGDAELKSAGNGWRVAKTDGADIVFTASDGTTKLNHELESYDGTGNTDRGGE